MSSLVKFENLNEIKHWCGLMADSDMVPESYRGRAANVLVAAEWGAAVGVSAMQAINGICFIKGTPTLKAQFMAALVRARGHKLRIITNPGIATVIITRKDDPDFEFKSIWTVDRARNAGLLEKDMWKKYESNMLKARAISECCRDADSGALAGIVYTPEEIASTVGVVVNADGDPIEPPVMVDSFRASKKQVEEAVVTEAKPALVENAGRALGERLRTVVKSTAEAMDLLAKCGLTMERGDYTVGQNGRIQWDKVLPEAAALVHAYLDKPASQPAEPEFDQETGEVSDSTVISEEVAKEIRKQRALLMLSKIDVNAIVHGGGAVQLLSPEAADEWVKQ